jgi:hypothetical protein
VLTAEKPLVKGKALQVVYLPVNAYTGVREGMARKQSDLDLRQHKCRLLMAQVNNPILTTAFERIQRLRPGL